MVCMNCEQRAATYYVQLELNGQRQALHLCQECYNRVGQEASQAQNKNYSKASSSASSASNGTCSSGETDVEKNSVLEKYGQNLSDIAKKGLIDPVIGRDVEIEQVIEILNRRNKNNPVLIGESGVGKTAIVEGLALKIEKGEVPTKLRNKKIVSLDVASLTSGTAYRGQFEERIKQLMEELKAQTDTILFIDEIHQLVGAGKTEGSMDAGNILKPALARGELRLIGATTLNEYRVIEKDAALERRMQPIKVNEPSVEATIDILEGLKPRYEAYHDVTYAPDVLEACVRLSDRYIQDRYLPDKAIDLLDQAGAKVNLQTSGNDKDSIEQRLEEIVKEKLTAAEKEDYEQAARLRQEELQLEEKLKGATESLHKSVSVQDIEYLLERKTGIPVGKLQQEEHNKLQDLSERLNKKVIAQEEAVHKVSRSIRRSRTGFARDGRPLASFLFVGPTGVGKTELARVLSEELFGDRRAMVRLDMSEYMEKHSVSRLIGSPPGYIGHDEAGQLTEAVRRRPYTVLLLDEMEKAHPDVQHMFLQVLEDGHLTDSQGRTVSFTDTIIVMTSNAQEPESYFKPEFINRLDGIIEFQSLSRESLLSIINLMLEAVQFKANEQGVQLNVSEQAKVKLVELGYDERYGARPLRRAIQEYVEDGIVDLLLADQDVIEVTVDVQDEQLVVNAVSPK